MLCTHLKQNFISKSHFNCVGYSASDNECPYVYETCTEEDAIEGSPCCLINVVYPDISGGNDCGLVHILVRITD